MTTKTQHYITALALSCLLLQGCAAVVVGAGVGAATAAHDRRTLGTQVDDKTVAARLKTALSNNQALEDGANINIQVFNGVALLVGQSPNEDLKTQAQRTAEGVKNVRKFHNQIRIGSPIPASTVANDVWLSSKVRTSLIADKRINGLHISVTVEDSEVFLMGLVSEREANIAVEVSRNVSGVARVVKAFEYQ